MAISLPPDVILAMGQLRPILRNPRFWIGLLGMGLALGIAGPFGTQTTVPILPRLAYWVFMMLVTGTTGLILCRTFSTALSRTALPRLVVATLAGLLAGGPITAIVLACNAILLHPGDVSVGTTALILSLFAISAFISVTVSQIFFSDPPAPPLPPYHPPPGLMARLPAPLRAPLIGLTATGHYTEVTTTAGKTRLLLRLSDAIAESTPTPGLRIHRSHWVALDQITATRRDGPRAIVTLSDGSERPFSRTFLPLLQDAGLLPPEAP